MNNRRTKKTIELEALRKEAEKILGKPVGNVKLLDNNTLQVEQIDSKGHQEFVKLANGMIVPVPSRKDTRDLEREVKAALKSGRPIRLDKC